MEFVMLKNCWNNPQIWGLLLPRGLIKMEQSHFLVRRTLCLQSIGHRRSPRLVTTTHTPVTDLILRVPYSFLKS